jgi:hypothetical protein
MAGVGASKGAHRELAGEGKEEGSRGRDWLGWRWRCHGGSCIGEGSQPFTPYSCVVVCCCVLCAGRRKEKRREEKKRMRKKRTKCKKFIYMEISGNCSAGFWLTQLRGPPGHLAQLTSPPTSSRTRCNRWLANWPHTTALRVL